MVKKYFFVIFFLIFASSQVSGSQNKETQNRLATLGAKNIINIGNNGTTYQTFSCERTISVKFNDPEHQYIH